jgi:RHS repeat-associated protein
VYIQNAGKDTLYFAHTDYQGSLIALSLPNTSVAERYAYDPWGKRRNPTNWTQNETRTAFVLNRGYTMHEHLPEFNLINMNGRVYDPITAMFFSPDPYLQAPGNWLNYNRYGYALNNPFLYTDPDGEWIHIVIGAIIGGVVNWVAHGAEFSWDGLAAFGIGAAGGAVIAATGGAAMGVFGTTAGAGGFIGGVIASGVGYSFGTAVTSIGNNAFFGDPMPTAGQFLSGLGITMATGGLFNGTLAAANGRNFLTGNMNIPQPTLPDLNLANLPKAELKQPDLGKTVDQMKAPLKDLSGNSVPKNMYALDNQTPLIKMTGDGIQNPYWRDSNFRSNLIKASGIDPGKAAQAHYVFPVSQGDRFINVGIDVNKYGAWWETGSHSKNAYQYNNAWDAFFIKNANPTQYQVWQEMLRLKGIYGY